jgi:hypothetical protein
MGTGNSIIDITALVAIMPLAIVWLVNLARLGLRKYEKVIPSVVWHVLSGGLAILSVFLLNINWTTLLPAQISVPGASGQVLSAVAIAGVASAWHNFLENQSTKSKARMADTHIALHAAGLSHDDVNIVHLDRL